MGKNISFSLVFQILNHNSKHDFQKAHPNPWWEPHNVIPYPDSLHHQLSGHELEQTLGDGEGQEGPVCCSPRGHKESDMTEGLNNSSMYRAGHPSSDAGSQACLVGLLVFYLGFVF